MHQLRFFQSALLSLVIGFSALTYAQTQVLPRKDAQAQPFYVQAVKKTLWQLKESKSFSQKFEHFSQLKNTIGRIIEVEATKLEKADGTQGQEAATEELRSLIEFEGYLDLIASNTNGPKSCEGAQTLLSLNLANEESSENLKSQASFELSMAQSILKGLCSK